MKIRVADLRPNPFRDFRVWPLNEEQLDSVARSIRATRSWDTWPARQGTGENTGKYEIVFGHHRLAVLKKRDPKGEVDIPVKDYSDDEMVKLMVTESAPQWNESKAAAIGAIRTLRRYLKTRGANDSPRGGSLPKRKSGLPGAKTMRAFLGPGGPWTEKRLENILEVVAPREKREVEEAELARLPRLSDERKLIPRMRNKPPPEQHKMVNNYMKGFHYQSEIFPTDEGATVRWHLGMLGSQASKLHDWIVYNLLTFEDKLDREEYVADAEHHLLAAQQLHHALGKVLALTDRARRKAGKGRKTAGRPVRRR